MVLFELLDAARQSGVWLGRGREFPGELGDALLEFGDAGLGGACLGLELFAGGGFELEFRLEPGEGEARGIELVFETGGAGEVGLGLNLGGVEIVAELIAER